MEGVGVGHGARALKHVQVREFLRDVAAEAGPGATTPSERELSQRFGVARMTVRQATDALVAEGVLVRLPGRGTFVARPRPPAGRLLSFTREMARRGMVAESQTLVARVEKAGPSVARALEITEGDAVLHWRRLRSADGQPVCVQDAYLVEVLLPGLLSRPLPTSLWDDLAERGLAPTDAETSVTASLATPAEQDLLDVPEGSPTLRVDQLVASGDQQVEVSRSTYRADRYSLQLHLADPRDLG